MKNIEKWIIVILTVIAVAAIGTAVYFGINENDNKTELKGEQINKENNEQDTLDENIENNEGINQDETNEEKDRVDLDTILQNAITNKQVLEKYKKITWVGDIEADICNRSDIYTNDFELTDKFKQCISLDKTELKDINDSNKNNLDKIFKGYRDDIDVVENASGYFTADDLSDTWYNLFNEKKANIDFTLNDYSLTCPEIIYKNDMFLKIYNCGGIMGISIEKLNIEYEEKNEKYYVYETVGFYHNGKIYVDDPLKQDVKSFVYDNTFNLSEHSEFHTYRYIFEKNNDDVIYLSAIEIVK